MVDDDVAREGLNGVSAGVLYEEFCDTYDKEAAAIVSADSAVNTKDIRELQYDVRDLRDFCLAQQQSLGHLQYQVRDLWCLGDRFRSGGGTGS